MPKKYVGFDVKWSKGTFTIYSCGYCFDQQFTAGREIENETKSCYLNSIYNECFNDNFIAAKSPAKQLNSKVMMCLCIFFCRLIFQQISRNSQNCLWKLAVLNMTHCVNRLKKWKGKSQFFARSEYSQTWILLNRTI